MNDFSTLRSFLAREVRRTSYRKTAQRVGIGHRTVWNIVNGVSDNPGLKTMEKIQKAMREMDRNDHPVTSARGPCYSHDICGDDCIQDCPHYREEPNGK